MLLGLKIALGNFLILLPNSVLEFIGAFHSLWLEFSNKTLDVSSTASRLAWNISIAKIVDIAVACFTDLTMASISLESACTDCCCIYRYAAEEKRSACELIAISLRALFSHISKFLIGMEHFPLLDRSNREASDSNGGMLSVGKY